MKLALGTAQFGLNYGIANQSGKVTHDEATAILLAARAAGINTLDTAIAYGDSEACLGAVGVGDWKVVSKLPNLPVECRDVVPWVEERVTSSLRLLNINHLYGFLVHDSRQLVGSRGVMLACALKSLRNNGLVKKIGVSIYSPEELEPIYTVLQPDLVQCPLNIVDRRLIESGWLNRLAEDGVEVHTRSAFLQGLLLMQKVPSRFSRWKKLWALWQEWLMMHPGKAIAACLAYPLSQSQISRVIVGVDSLWHLNQVLVAVQQLPCIDVLPDLQCTDELLINPSKWYAL